MQKSLIEGYFDFLENLLSICEVSEELADLPIKIIDEPQFDSDNLPAIQEFLAPGVFVLTVFFLANVLSGEFFIEERLVSKDDSDLQGFKKSTSQYCKQHSNFGLSWPG